MRTNNNLDAATPQRRTARALSHRHFLASLGSARERSSEETQDKMEPPRHALARLLLVHDIMVTMPSSLSAARRAVRLRQFKVETRIDV